MSDREAKDEAITLLRSLDPLFSPSSVSLFCLPSILPPSLARRLWLFHFLLKPVSLSSVCSAIVSLSPSLSRCRCVCLLARVRQQVDCSFTQSQSWFIFTLKQKALMIRAARVRPSSSSSSFSFSLNNSCHRKVTAVAIQLPLLLVLAVALSLYFFYFSCALLLMLLLVLRSPCHSLTLQLTLFAFTAVQSLFSPLPLSLSVMRNAPVKVYAKAKFNLHIHSRVIVFHWCWVIFISLYIALCTLHYFADIRLSRAHRKNTATIETVFSVHYIRQLLHANCDTHYTPPLPLQTHASPHCSILTFFNSHRCTFCISRVISSCFVLTTVAKNALHLSSSSVQFNSLFSCLLKYRLQSGKRDGRVRWVTVREMFSLSHRRSSLACHKLSAAVSWHLSSVRISPLKMYTTSHYQWEQFVNDRSLRENVKINSQFVGSRHWVNDGERMFSLSRTVIWEGKNC